MALTLRNRPVGPIFSTSGLSATITDSSNTALVTYNSHGLSTGDYVLVVSNYTYYSGVWQIVLNDSNSFRITKFSGHPVVEYVVNDSITFYKTQSLSYFNSVHLPIIYSFTNDLFPVNIVDSTVTVNTFTNDQGYTKITTSATIKTGMTALEFVKLTVNSVEGIYQILQVFSTTQITIDLPYDGGNVFGNCQYYYANYHSKIKVYGGITGTGSEYNAVKLLATIEAVPRAVTTTSTVNLTEVNINEILKSKIDLLKNDPLGVGIPRDLDAFCEFYIEYAESYDDSSDGYTLGTYTSSYTSDAATPCYAVNAKLPFKNRYSGWMSEYAGNSRNFLSTMSSPSLWIDKYIDIAFIRQSYYNLYLRRLWYEGGVYYDYDSVADYGNGVYRMPITLNGGTLSALPSLSSFISTGSGVAWTTGANPSVTISSTGSAYLQAPFNVMSGITYVFSYNIDVTDSGDLDVVTIELVEGDTSVGTATQITLTSAENTGQRSITATGNGSAIRISIDKGPAISPNTIDIDSFTLDSSTSLLTEFIDVTLVTYNNPASTTLTSTATNTSTGTVSQSNTENYFLKAGVAPTEGYDYTATVGAPAGASDAAVCTINYLHSDGTTTNVVNISQTTLGTSSSSGTLPTPTKDVVSITYSASATNGGGANTVTATTRLLSMISETYHPVSETKTMDIDSDCYNNSIYLTWKNYLGGHDYWLFTAEKEYGVDIIETTESTKNIFPEWPKSYGEFSDTIDFETSRRSKDTILVRSQNLTLAQVTGLKYIKTSPLVQIMESSSDRRTVIVDPNSFVVYNETDKIYGIQFTIRYTDDIPSQSL